MKRTVVGTFENAEAARHGVDALVAAGLPKDEMLPVETDESGRVLVTVHTSMGLVETARGALLAAGATAVAVDAKVS